MKKVLCLVLSVILFSLSFSFLSPLPASASVDSLFDISLDTVFNYAKLLFDNYTTSQCKKISAARSFYFYIILNDVYSSGFSVFDDSGTKFSDDILNFYYQQYSTTKTSGDIYNSSGDIFIQAAGFPSTPWSLRLCSFGVDVEKPGTSYVGDWDKPYFKSYYQSYLARYLIAQGENATDPNPGKSGLDIAPGYVSSDELVDSINFDNTQYFPKTSNTWLMSYRNEKRYQTLIRNNKAFFPSFVLSDDSSGNIAFSELFLLPFFKDKNGEVYYAKKQLHIYLRQWDDPNSDIYLGFDVFDFSSDFTSPVEIKSDNHIVDLTSSSLPAKYSVSPFPYYATNGVSFYRFETLSKFIDNSCLTTYILDNSSYNTAGYWDFYNSSQTDYKNMFKLFYNSSDDKTYYYNLFKNLWGSEYDDGFSDIGYIASKSLINFAYNDIDTSKIPSGQIVTVNGDTIYNYTITNPDTGDSSKFGDYITNNFTYITNNYGEGGSGSGVGGNVTVDGSIDVGGSVGVDINVSVPDININVNGNGGAGGSGSSIANPDDFTSAENVDLNKYYDEAVEQSTGFQKFLNDFFGFLPAELLALILFAVAMAIVCRVFGR